MKKTLILCCYFWMVGCSASPENIENKEVGNKVVSELNDTQIALNKEFQSKVGNRKVARLHGPSKIPFALGYTKSDGSIKDTLDSAQIHFEKAISPTEAVYRNYKNAEVLVTLESDNKSMNVNFTDTGFNTLYIFN